MVSTAQVLAHRFYVYQSFKQHDRYIISVASLFLAGKVEESMIKYKHLQVIVRTYLMYRKKMNSSFDADLKETEKKVLVAERILLQTLCFDVQVTHPYADSYKKIKNSLKCEYKNTLIHTCISMHLCIQCVGSKYIYYLFMG